ncbi:MAG TPA: hypothetical protein VE079_12280 [Ensifer sp.]|nr:hypothetical protein [Ensifer sp.]
MAGENDNRQSAIAAGIFLLVAGLALYFMPNIVLWIGGFSPVLAVIVGVAAIGAFFGVFWVRAWFQRR